MNQYSFWICIAFLLSSCATPYSTMKKYYQEATICCESINQFNFELIQIGDSKYFDLNERSPAYFFETGKSYFKAFALPQSYPYQLSIGSYMHGYFGPEYIFFPQILTLNENYKVVRLTDQNHFRLRRIGYFENGKPIWGPPYKIEGQISFTEENKNEKYLIIFTTNELLKGKTSISSMSFYPMYIHGVGIIHLPLSNVEVSVPYSPVGRIRVSVDSIKE